MASQSGLVEVDGSYGEGGGQLLRTAVALSAITKKAVRIENIRAGRPNPGLQAQHLKGVEAVAILCGAKCLGARIGSTELFFEPGELRPRALNVDIGTAGATTLVLQALVLAAGRLGGMTTVELAGGTHVSWSPPTDYFEEVFSHHLKSLGIDARVETLRHGFYPKGGGRVRAEIRGSPDWHPMDLEKAGAAKEVILHSVASESLRDARVAERQVEGFKSVLGGVASEEAIYVPSLSIGSAVSASAHCGQTVLGGDALGRKGLKAEEVGREAAKTLKAEIDSGASLDVHASDMVLPYLALASGPSRFAVRELSAHFTSVQWLVRQFIDVEFKVERKGNLHMVTVIPKREP